MDCLIPEECLTVSAIIEKSIDADGSKVGGLINGLFSGCEPRR
jgi:hypothetical protein